MENALKTAENAVAGIQAVIPTSVPSYEAPPLEPAYTNDSFEETSEEIESMGSKVPQTKLPWE